MMQNAFTIGALVLLASCTAPVSTDNKEEAMEQAQYNLDEVLKIYVNDQGEVISNGEQTSLEELDGQLKALKGNNGVVYYSRGNIAGEPPANAMEVVKLIVKYQLPLKFFTDQTFTTLAEIK